MVGHEPLRVLMQSVQRVDNKIGQAAVASKKSVQVSGFLVIAIRQAIGRGIGKGAGSRSMSMRGGKAGRGLVCTNVIVQPILYGVQERSLQARRTGHDYWRIE